MTSSTVRVLLVADTHLGFDLPQRPRVERRRRGHDFFANLDLALRPAFQGDVDLMVHGGDLLYRSKVPPLLVEQALAPLVSVAETGIPVFLVPGNHERSRIPLHLWARHPNLHIFDRPQTFVCHTANGSLALAGFPFVRQVRAQFAALVDQTGYRQVVADARLLCVHQAVEGAQVGPGSFTFRGGPDVVSGSDLPRGFAAVLAGHIHRAQILTHHLPAPVIYPGSVERTSFAERNEDKAYALVNLDLRRDGGPELQVAFVPLPARPMVELTFEPHDPPPGATVSEGRDSLLAQLRAELAALDPDSIVRIRLCGPPGTADVGHAGAAREILTAACLRELAPPTMNVELSPPPL
jgi:DNA repair exonuclease SbcCD nuclease subunit